MVNIVKIFLESTENIYLFCVFQRNNRYDKQLVKINSPNFYKKVPILKKYILAYLLREKQTFDIHTWLAQLGIDNPTS